MQDIDKFNREVESIQEIKVSGTFQSFYEACRILEEKNYQVGSMCCNLPIGFADKEKCNYVAKWHNLDKSDIEKLDGVLLSDDFREGSVKIVIFKK
jgi:hypothetical protein